MILYELYSPTCVPCKMLKPRFEDLKKEYPSLEVRYLNLMEYVNRPLESVMEDENLPKAIRENIDSIKGTPHVFLLDEEGNAVLNKHADFNILQEIKTFLQK